MKKYIVMAVVALMALTTTFTSCSDVTLENAPYSEPVSNLSFTQTKKDVTMSWTAPSGATEVAVFLDNTQKASLPVSTTSYTFKNVADGATHIYTAKAIYGNEGRISEGVSDTLSLESKTKAAFLLPTGVNDYTSLPDDDEQAAGKFFKENFVDDNKGQFIHVSDIANLDLDVVPVIWIMIDRVGMGSGSANLTKVYSTSEIATIKSFVQKGGNLFLSNHATMMATAIGRMPYEVTCFGDGEGGTHSDIWATTTILGAGMGTIYDRSSHDIFSGITQDNYNAYGHNTIALLGPGTQEDHNCFWIPADVPGRTWGDNGDVNTIPTYEKALTCQILAGWGQVTDYCVGAIVEFQPTADFKGTVLCNGLAAYEWHQNQPASGDQNVYQNNIEKLTTNTLNYLK